MRLPAVPKVLLALDAITITRKSTTVDSEGSPAPPGVVFSGRGTVFALKASDLIDAGARKSLVDAGVAVPSATDIRPDDRVSTPRGDFVVVSIEDRRLYRRALIRKVK